jgi:glycosyltransferase involved in cell wall biosynthesis
MNDDSYYIVRNIDLATDAEIHFSQDERYYFVFWYKAVPLGQFYSPWDMQTTETFFWKVCLKSIESTLRHYADKLDPAHEVIESDHADRALITHLCKTIIEPFVPVDIPATCPVSLVICTRDRADYLKNCLASLQQQVSLPQEIIVVDNASRDDATRQVAAQFRNIKYVREDRPGLDVARNTGARNSTCAIVAYTDDDTLLHRYWVYQVYRAFDDNATQAMTGLVIAASLDTEAQMIFEKHWPFNRGYVDKKYDSKFFAATCKQGTPVWEVGAGANMAFRKELFDKVGYFDERLDVGAAGCSGDSELWYRILAHGYTIHYNPRAVVHHLHRNSMEGLKKQLYYYMRGFTVAILIQYHRFRHRGNLKHLFWAVPKWYVYLFRKGFPNYRFQYRTLLSEVRGIFSGLFFYLRHRHQDPQIFPQHEKN